jgi:hypothetical protein
MPRRAHPSGARRARRRVLHPRRIERRPPASIILLSQLQVIALAVHVHCDVSDPSPRVQPRAESVEGAVRRGHGTPGESKCCPEELAALVEHPLLDHLVRLQDDGLRNRQPEGFGGLEVDDQFEPRGLFDG